MPEYFGDVKMDFDGTICEKRMMERLLNLMDLDSREDYPDYYHLPFDECYDMYPKTALPGVVIDGNGPGFSWNINFDHAPRLFAALFPQSSFRYAISMSSDNSGEKWYAFAMYNNNVLMIWHCDLYNDTDEEEFICACRQIIDSSPDVKKRYKKYCKEKGYGSGGGDLAFIIGFLVDNPHETLESLYNYGGAKSPSRNVQYEKSFFDEGDLQEYLVSEQIKEQEMSLTEYIKAFPFTKEQFQHFIKVAADSHFAEMTAFLLAEQQLRFEQ